MIQLIVLLYRKNLENIQLKVQHLLGLDCKSITVNILDKINFMGYQLVLIVLEPVIENNAENYILAP